MGRAIILTLILVLAIFAALAFFSTRVEEQPTQPVEVEVNLPADAR